MKKSYELVATKCGADSKLALDFCKDISDKFRCKYFKTDAINKENVEEPFIYIASDIIDQTGKNENFLVIIRYKVRKFRVYSLIQLPNCRSFGETIRCVQYLYVNSAMINREIRISRTRLDKRILEEFFGMIKGYPKMKEISFMCITMYLVF